MNKQIVWGIAGICVAVLLLAALAMTLKTAPQNTGEDTTSTASSSTSSESTKTPQVKAPTKSADAYVLPTNGDKFKTIEVDGEMVSVTDQKAGSTVTVDDVQVSRPTWVAIKDVRGWVMGAAWVSTSKASVTISLLRPTVAGDAYQALMFIDNGNKKFEMYDDSLVVFDGAPVGLTFNAN